MSQEQLAEKLCVSRQAVTKWENDKGMPNIESLQAIAKLFDVSVDFLLTDKDVCSGTIVKESINISEYENIGNCRSKYDAVVKAKFPKAQKITPLVRRKKLNWIENIVSPGVLQLTDSLKDISAYYLVELENRQLLVYVTKDFIESREMASAFTQKKKVIGSNLFIKSSYTI